MSKESHNFEHSHIHNPQALKDVKFTMFLNLFFAILELVTYFFTNSVAMFSSAIHDFGDVIILFFSVLIEKFSAKGRNNKYTYGYRRFTLVAATINSAVLLFASVFIIKNALFRLYNPEPINANIVLIMAMIGVGVNVIGVIKVSKKQSILNKSLALNLKSDIYNFLFIIIGAVLMILFEVQYIDSLFSIFIAFKMIVEVFKDMRRIFTMMMQSIPVDIDYNQIEEHIKNFPNIIDVHDIHIWDLDGEDYIMSMHIVVDFNVLDIEQTMKLKNDLKLELEKFKINHTTIEIDSTDYARKIGEL